MTFLRKVKQRIYFNDESGVSLMLAVLVLAAITAVAFSLATIVFVEIRSSGDSLRTEPALYGTFAVTEEALFQYKRFYDPTTSDADDAFHVPSCSGPEDSNVCTINGVSLTMPGVQPIAFDNSPQVVQVPPDTIVTLPMYITDNFDQQYTASCVEVLPNETLSNIDLTYQVTNEDGTTAIAYTSTIGPGEVCDGGFTGFNSSGQYELILENNTTDQLVNVSVDTIRVNNAQPAGLPFVGEQVLRIVADYLGLTRTYQVRIPIP